MSNNDLFRQNESILSLVSRFLDIAVVAGTGWIAHWAYFSTFDLDPAYKLGLILGAVLTVVIFPLFDNYQSWRGRNWFDQLRAVFLSQLSVMVSLVVISALLKNTAVFSRLWFAIWAILSLITLFTYKRLLMMGLREMRLRGWNRKRIIILGAGDLGRKVAGHISNAEWTGFEIAAYFDDNSQVAGQKLDGVPVHHLNGNLESFIEGNKIQEVWLALPLRAESRMKEILQTLQNSTVAVRFVPDIFTFNLLIGPSVSEIAGIPVLDINCSPISGINWAIKEAEDRVLAAIILVMISPILAIIAAAIRLESRGPVIFKQERHGWDGRIIKVYKFRSMGVMESSGAFTQATKNDPRVTRVGAFIRRTSLDELPQFFNVLQGRMSIVGPRPHPVSMNNEYKTKVAYYFQRHKVKPGITGLAQINGCRGETDTLDKMERRIAFDIQYIQNWSIWLDLKIIFLTIFKGFVSDKAY